MRGTRRRTITSITERALKKIRAFTVLSVARPHTSLQSEWLLFTQGGVCIYVLAESPVVYPAATAAGSEDLEQPILPAVKSDSSISAYRFSSQRLHHASPITSQCDDDRVGRLTSVTPVVCWGRPSTGLLWMIKQAVNFAFRAALAVISTNAHKLLGIRYSAAEVWRSRLNVDPHLLKPTWALSP